MVQKYPTITKQYFGSQDVEIIKIEGSVELVRLVGLADAIVDITETGTTFEKIILKSMIGSNQSLRVLWQIHWH